MGRARLSQDGRSWLTAAQQVRDQRVLVVLTPGDRDPRVRAVLGSILRKATPLRRMRRMLAGATETPRPVCTRAQRRSAIPSRAGSPGARSLPRCTGR